MRRGIFRRALCAGLAVLLACAPARAVWTVPDKGTAQNDFQSILYAEYHKALMAGLGGIDLPLTGLAVTAQGTPDMTVAVAAGSALTNRALKSVSAGNGTITTANATNPRIDLVVINSSGAIAVRAGTAAAVPKPPARSANDVVLAAVYVPANDTTITNDQIVDLRAPTPPSYGVSLAADLTVSSTTPSEATGITLPLEPGTYTFHYYLLYQTAATTTGVKASVNFDGTASKLVATHSWMIAATAASSGAADQDVALAASGGVMSGQAQRAGSTAGLGSTASVDTATADMLYEISGMLIVTATGNLELWWGSEVGSSNAVLKAGSSLIITRAG